MAKKKVSWVRLVSTAGTGYFYVRKRNKQTTEKWTLKKYDPKVRKHVLFREAKMK